MTEVELEKFMKKVESLDCTKADFFIYWTQILKAPEEDVKLAYQMHINDLAKAIYKIH